MLPSEQPDVPKIGPLTDDEYLQVVQETYLEKYLTSLGKFTFRSLDIPLSSAMANALVEAHDRNQNTRDHFSSLVEDLISSIDAAKRQLGCTSIFVRLSTRSPKDAVVNDPEFDSKQRSVETELLTRETAAVTTTSNFNRRLHAFYETARRGMASPDGSHAVQLIIRSVRLIQDLRAAASSSPSDLRVIVREFQDFDVSNEFRLFICRKRLTAATSYIPQVYFPQLHQRKVLVEKAMRAFVEREVIPVIPLQHYIVDLVVRFDTNSASPDVKIIEINPFASFAETMYFHWTSEADLKVLLGDAPFEFRIMESCEM